MTHYTIYFCTQCRLQLRSPDLGETRKCPVCFCPHAFKSEITTIENVLLKIKRSAASRGSFIKGHYTFSDEIICRIQYPLGLRNRIVSSPPKPFSSPPKPFSLLKENRIILQKN